MRRWFPQIAPLLFLIDWVVTLGCEMCARYFSADRPDFSYVILGLSRGDLVGLRGVELRVFNSGI